MSTEIMKKAFALFNCDLKSDNLLEHNPDSEHKQKKKKKTKLKKSDLKSSVNGPFSFVSSKSAIDEYKKKHRNDSEDNLEDNLQLLNKLREIKPKETASLKILEHQEKLFNKRVIQLPDIKPPEPESVLFPELNKKKKKKGKKRKHT